MLRRISQLVIILSAVVLILSGCATSNDQAKEVNINGTKATVCKNAKGDYEISKEAKEKGDIKICNGIKSECARENCYYNLIVDGKTTEGDCGGLLGKDSQDDCYAQLARDQKNSSLCDQISSDKGKLSCYDDLGIAPTLVGVSACNSERNDEAKWECFIDAAKESKNSDVCKNISDRDRRRSCYNASEFTGKDLSFCVAMGIQDDNAQQDCYKVVSVAVKDASGCEKIIDGEDQQDCYFKVALVTNNTDICAKIESTGYRQYSSYVYSNSGCYPKIAAQTLDLSICQKLKDAALVRKESQRYVGPFMTMANACYDAVAKAKKDAKICDNIADQRDKGACLDLVSGKLK